jgi:hypothetical protein
VLQTARAIETPPEIVAALRLIGEHYHDRRGVWAYDVFGAINAAYFESKLPTPLIQWALTPHGHCLGQTMPTRRPIVTLHPSLLGGTESDDPWGFNPEWLGIAFAFDTLLHEAIHVSQHCLLGGGVGTSSHNNTAWMSEVNRIAPLLGFSGIEAGLSKTKRVPIEGQFTKTGKPATKVVRYSEGNIPHDAAARFPRGLRQHLGTAAAFYTAKILPVTYSCMLQEIA